MTRLAKKRRAHLLERIGFEKAWARTDSGEKNGDSWERAMRILSSIGGSICFPAVEDLVVILL